VVRGIVRDFAGKQGSLVLGPGKTIRSSRHSASSGIFYDLVCRLQKICKENEGNHGEKQIPQQLERKVEDEFQQNVPEKSDTEGGFLFFCELDKKKQPSQDEIGILHGGGYRDRVDHADIEEGSLGLLR
jgi:hypothetical protein